MNEKSEFLKAAKSAGIKAFAAEEVFDMITTTVKDLICCGNCDHSEYQTGVTTEGLVVEYVTCPKVHEIIHTKKTNCEFWERDPGRE